MQIKTLDHKVTVWGLIASFIVVSIFMAIFTRKISKMQEEITITQTQASVIFGNKYK